MERKEDYKEVLSAFEAIWVQKNLPFDARRYMCGLVQAAAARQGEDAINRDLWQRMVNGEIPHPDEQMQMFEDIHEFVLIDRKLRKSYLYLVVRRTVDYLNKNFSHIPAQENVRSRTPHLN